MSIAVQQLSSVAVANQRIEFVERKGLGHPDSICDAMMEAICVALSQEYLRHFGRVLHHNIDKGLLVAGQSSPRFAGGDVRAPIRVVVGDRATNRVGDQIVPVRDIVDSAIKFWTKHHLRFVDPDRHIIVQNELQPGSAELTGIFQRDQVVANDTSAAVGYAPLSETDRLVLAAERFLNSPDFKRQHPETGEDVKVMGVRNDRRLALTVAIAMVARFVPSENAYFEAKQAVRDELLRHLQSRLETLDGISVDINTLDRRRCGQDGTYLTVLGTSAENGDGGQVGRGNRVNGLITLNRPMTLEAAAGKNPVSHVGKIYNLLAHQMAAAIYSELDGMDEVYVWMCSQIGEPVDRPWQISVQVALSKDAVISDIEPAVLNIVREHLANVTEFSARLSRGEYSVC